MSSPTVQAKDDDRAVQTGPSLLRRRLAELSKFFTVGGIAFVVDMGLFNLLALDGMVLDHKPTTAKIVSALVATVVSWLLNRSWTFRDGATNSRLREFTTFALINAAGIVIAAGVLWIAVYVFGVEDALGKNLASMLGIAVATVVRYLGYKLLVFRRTPSSTP